MEKFAALHFYIVHMSYELTFSLLSFSPPDLTLVNKYFHKIYGYRQCDYLIMTLPVSIFTARRIATAIPSVRLSVRPSVRHTPVLCQNDGT